jgi:predicted nicotinamide N-methyase
MKPLCLEPAPTIERPSDFLLEKFAPLGAVGGCDGIIAHQADDLFALWEAWEAESRADCATPFWAAVWPAAGVLARHIQHHRSLVEGKTVLDIGCGGGVVCIAAARAGACRVIANDIDPVALAIAWRNFAANEVEVEIHSQNVAEEEFPITAEIILVADMFYHRSASTSLLAYLHRARRNGSTVLIADSHRPFTPTTGISLIAKETVPVSMEVEGVPHREVRILALD